MLKRVENSKIEPTLIIEPSDNDKEPFALKGLVFVGKFLMSCGHVVVRVSKRPFALFGMLALRCDECKEEE